ncbi:murein hydrolase activator EnvC family protein [Oceaniglobus ichthyenteri]|uniref:murein hydrolase activator EnvC family protein n=1 Tax=Oceaniglobus ichthyenteri TaxID=2136177 RepID=UPI000D3BFC2E|nr:peptidoglycan DD-metalloendopeptidase family protein [Oceaniglobus ichthyenteri]
MIRWAFILILAWPGHVAAQADPVTIARRAASQLDIAARELADAEGARDRISALTRTIRAYENGLAALREGVRQAVQREAKIRAQFDAQSAQLGGLLAALQTMQTSPEALLLLHPSGAIGTARSGMILSDVTPALLAKVTDLRADLGEIATLRALQAGAEDTLEEGLSGAQQARTALAAAMSDRTDLPRRMTEDNDQMQRLIESAETLEGFATGLTVLPDDPVAQSLPGFAAAKGDLTLPVRGRVIAGFDQGDAAGVRRPGILIATAPGALVTTPWPATIRYRGPLLDYGNVMILEPEAGYLLVLAGMKQVYGETGQVIPAETPVGLMGGNTRPELAGFGTGTGNEDGQGRQETLYMELRDGQGPVDPATWFRMNED